MRMKRRSIPAWAGETAYPNRPPCWIEVYPRVGGGNAGIRYHGGRREGLSPRGRGKRARGRRYAAPSRSIPAWAGETISAPQARFGVKVYPRVGGGNGFNIKVGCGR